MWANVASHLPVLFAITFPLAQLPFSTAAPNCPLIGPEFPAPYNLESHPIWKAAIQNITNVFQYIDVSNITGVDLFSYSIQIFSTNPGSPILWERHRTAKDLPRNTTGVKKVDGDTVYRLGSVTKVFSVLTFLAEAGDVHWNMPITKFVPELAKYSGRSTQPDFDPVKETDWDDITIGSLASQVSGLGRDCEYTKPTNLAFVPTSEQMAFLERSRRLMTCLLPGRLDFLSFLILLCLHAAHGPFALGNVSFFFTDFSSHA